MTRRDLIIVAVLANIGVLAILFMLAFRTEEESVKENKEVAYTITEETVNPLQPPVELQAPSKPEPVDMIDAALEEENAAPAPSIITADDDSFQIIEPETHEPKPAQLKSEEAAPADETKFVDVTVKSGDALEKIARANGTTVEAIMKANNLKSDRLKIGQVLKVPVGTRKKPAASAPTPSKQIAQADSSGKGEYYTLKSGDNPWKIAKQFNMKLDELLKLNNLNEEKARNLKIGDTVRVK